MMINKSTITKAGLIWFFSATEKEWHLSEKEKKKLLGCPDQETYLKWKKDKTGLLPEDVIERLSYLYRIYKILSSYFNQSSTLEWLNNPNDAPLFTGKSPLDYMLSNENLALAKIIDYLENPEFCRNS